MRILDASKLRLNRDLNCLALVFLVLLWFCPSVVYGQGTICYFTSTNILAPGGQSLESTPTFSWPAGQPLEVDVTFTVACPEGGTYIIRLDLVETATSKTLSTSQTMYSTIGSYTATVQNYLVAPPTLGSWVLQVNIYMLTLSGVPVAPQSQKSFVITIVPYVPTTSTSTIITSLSAITIVSSAFVSSVTTPTRVVVMSSTMTSSVRPVSPDNSLLMGVSGLIAIMVGLVAVLTIRKRQCAKRDHTRVY